MMRQVMQLKVASLSDWQRFRDIRRMALSTDAHAFGKPFELDAKGGQAHWQKVLGIEDRYVFAIECNGSFVVTAGTKRVKDDLWMLFGVYTPPAFRRNGFARLLVSHAIEEASSRGAKRIILAVNSKQREAIALYHELGFRTFERKRGQYAADGNLHEELRMEAALERRKDLLRALSIS